MENVKTVLCFSPTGSCLTVARVLCGRGDRLIDFTLPQCREIPPVFSADGEAVFVLPVYNRSIPDVCTEYIKALDGKGCNACVICVYGGVTKGKSLQKAAKLLSDSGFVPTKGAYIPAPHFYSAEKLNILFPERLERLRSFLDNGFTANKKAVFSNADKPSVQSLMKSLTGKCVKDNSKCDLCGNCAKVCPVDAVKNDFSVSSYCILCGACVKACPQNARRIKFFSAIPPLFIKLNCKRRDDEFFFFPPSSVSSKRLGH